MDHCGDSRNFWRSDIAICHCPERRSGNQPQLSRFFSGGYLDGQESHHSDGLVGRLYRLRTIDLRRFYNSERGKAGR